MLISSRVFSGRIKLMAKIQKQESAIFLIVIGVAILFRMYGLDTLPPIFENKLLSLRVFSALIGILTIIGTYLLTKEMFNWKLASIASYLMAISFWHVNLSRTENIAIMIPFLMVYTFFFLWRGIKTNNFYNFVMAGIFGGLACLPTGRDLVFTPFTLTPFIVVAVFVNYWWYLKKDFGYSKYEHTKTKLLQGFVIFFLIALVVSLPSLISMWQNQQGLYLGTFSFSNFIKTFGMFNFSGDLNPKQNIPNSPIFSWPIGIFFIIGFINEFTHWLKRKHGHFSTTHTLLFVWFFTMLIPGFLSSNSPDSFLTVGALPVVMIFTAQGIKWFFEKLSLWYKINDRHSIHLPAQTGESHAITTLVMILFLFSIGFMEYWRYFKVWVVSQ